MKKLLYSLIIIVAILPLAFIFSACNGESSAPQNDRIALSLSMVEEIDDMIYNGETLKPKVVLKHDNKVLVEGKDYNLSYGENVNAGDGVVYITGCGNYRQTIICKFKILSSLQEKLDTLKTGETLVLNQNYTGSFNISNGVTLIIDKNYVLKIDGEIHVEENASIINNGKIIVDQNASIKCDDAQMTNNGQITLSGEIVESSSTKEIVNTGLIIMNGGVLNVPNSFKNEGEIRITYGSIFYVNNLSQLTSYNNIIKSSNISDNKIILASNIDLEESSFTNYRKTILDFNSFSLNNGTISNYGTLVIRNSKDLVSALASSKSGSSVIVKDIKSIELTEVVTIPSGVNLILASSLSISSNNPSNAYIDCNGAIIGTENISMFLNNAGIIKNAENIYDQNTMLINNVKAGKYIWNSTELKWEYVPQQ